MVTGAFQETERINDTVQLSQEVRVYSQSESRFQWLLGALYWSEDVEQFGSNDTGLALLADLFSIPMSPRSTTRATARAAISSRYTDHTSVFAWTEYALSEQRVCIRRSPLHGRGNPAHPGLRPAVQFLLRRDLRTGGASPPILSFIRSGDRISLRNDHGEVHHTAGRAQLPAG